MKKKFTTMAAVFFALAFLLGGSMTALAQDNGGDNGGNNGGTYNAPGGGDTNSPGNNMHSAASAHVLSAQYGGGTLPR